MIFLFKKSKLALGALTLSLLSGPTVLAADSSVSGVVHPEYVVESEPNNTTASPTPLIPYNTMIGKIFTSSDVDYFYYQNTSPYVQYVKFDLYNIPFGKNYDLVIYNQSNQILASSTSLTGLSEFCEVAVPKNSVVFALVKGVNSSFDDRNAYYLDVSFYQ